MPKELKIDLKTLAIIVSLLMAIGGAIWFFATKCNEIDHITITLDKAGTDITANEHQIGDVKGDVIGLQTKLEHISKNLESLRSEQRASTEKILEELKNE